MEGQQPRASWNGRRKERKVSRNGPVAQCRHCQLDGLDAFPGFLIDLRDWTKAKTAALVVKSISAASAPAPSDITFYPGIREALGPLMGNRMSAYLPLG